MNSNGILKGSLYGFAGILVVSLRDPDRDLKGFLQDSCGILMASFKEADRDRGGIVWVMTPRSLKQFQRCLEDDCGILRDPHGILTGSSREENKERTSDRVSTMLGILRCSTADRRTGLGVGDWSPMKALAALPPALPVALPDDPECGGDAELPPLRC